MCEKCIVLCQRFFEDENYRKRLDFVCSYTSGYFPIYDDEYGRVYYDDDRASHDIWRSTTLKTLLRTINSTIVGQGVRTA